MPLTYRLDKPNAKTEAERDVAESRVQSRELRKQAGQEGLGIKNP